MSEGGFVKVGKPSEFREGRGRVVKVDGVDVAVFKLGGRLFALEDACPHMGASLADGKLERSCVVCHWHGWKFDLRTGQGDQRAWARARVYEVKVEDDELLLKAPPQRDAERPPGDDEDWVAWDPERYFKKPR